MSGRLPDNLATLYASFSKEAIDAILPGESFWVDGIEFVCRYAPDSTAERFFIVKSPALIERYRQLCQQFEGGSIMELGIAEGGSTALMALLARPRKLVAVDLEPEPLEALSEFVAARDLGESVRAHYGVDQSDRERLAALADAELAGEPLDLVIDDCSHQLQPTRSSFETLFPRLRPGGLFVIEDWNADHLMVEAVARALRDPSSPADDAVKEEMRRAIAESAGQPTEKRPSLSQLAVELVLARASGREAIAEVVVDEFWVTVKRGTDELDPDGFRLADLYIDHVGFLPSPPSDGS